MVGPLRGRGERAAASWRKLAAGDARRLDRARQPFGPGRHPGDTLASAVAPTVLPVATRALVDACARLGLDTDRAPRAGGAGPGSPRRAGRPPPRLAGGRGLARGVAPLGDPALALRAAEQTPFGAFRVLDFLGATGATVGEGLARVAAYFPLVDPRGSITVEPAEDAVALSFRGADGVPPQPAQEYTLAILVSRVRHCAASPVGLGVRFAFPRPVSAAEHARVLGLEPVFGAAVPALVLARATWEAAPRAADAGLFATLEEHARELLGRTAPRIRSRRAVRAAIAAELPGKEPSLARVARRLGTSARTLQRRLGAAGTSFAAVVDAVRRERAEAFLRAPDVSIAEVSFLVGLRRAERVHARLPALDRDGPHGVAPAGGRGEGSAKVSRVQAQRRSSSRAASRVPSRRRRARRTGWGSWPRATRHALAPAPGFGLRRLRVGRWEVRSSYPWSPGRRASIGADDPPWIAKVPSGRGDSAGAERGRPASGLPWRRCAQHAAKRVEGLARFACFKADRDHSPPLRLLVALSRSVADGLTSRGKRDPACR